MAFNTAATERPLSGLVFCKMLDIHEVATFVVRNCLQYNGNNIKRITDNLDRMYLKIVGVRPFKYSLKAYKSGGFLAGLNSITGIAKDYREIPHELVSYIVFKYVNQETSLIYLKEEYFTKIVNFIRYGCKMLYNDLAGKYIVGNRQANLYTMNRLRAELFYKKYASSVVALYGKMYLNDPSVEIGILVDYLAETNIPLAHLIHEIGICGGLVNEDMTMLYNSYIISENLERTSCIPKEISYVVDSLPSYSPPFLQADMLTNFTSPNNKRNQIRNYLTAITPDNKRNEVRGYLAAITPTTVDSKFFNSPTNYVQEAINRRIL